MVNFLKIALLVSVFFGCTKKEEFNERVLNLRVGAEVKGFDPAFGDDRYSANEISNVYEGLLQFHYLKRPYTLVPNLAQEMPVVSADGLTYTFKLLQGVFFQDDKAFPNGKGRELVAEDFVYSIKRIADPKLQSAGWWVLDGKVKGLNEWRDKYADAEKVDYADEVEGLKAIDKYTVQFTLTKNFPQFLYALAMPFHFAVAKEVVEHYGTEFLNHPVGTGPFSLPVYDRSNRIVYSKNPTFRKKFYPADASEEYTQMGYLKDAGRQLPLVDKLIVNIITEDQPAWLSFQKAKLDFLAVPKDNFQSAITPQEKPTEDMIKKGIQLNITPSLDVTYIAFNHSLKIFENKKLRQAMSYAYNSDESNKLFFNGTGMVAQSVIPPGIAGYLADYKNPNKEFNIEKAKELLKEAGYPEGKGLPEITYDTTGTTVARQMGEFFAKQMEQIGITVKVVTNPWPELQKKINNRSAMTFGIAWGADYPDAENFLQLLYGPNQTPGANGSNYDNPEFNKLFASASIMQDSPERTALYEKMYRIAAEEVPWIFGLHRRSFVLFQGWLKNYVVSDFEAGMNQYLDVDLEKKQELSKKF